MGSTRDTIKKLMSEHTASGDLICAQSLCGAGALSNTISLKNKTGLIDFSISDSSNPCLAVGMALSKKVIYVIRFAGFGWINYFPILNYASKCKELWGYKCQLLIRCMVVENQIGPVASNANHSIVAHMPGIKVFAPMTSNEWQYMWDIFQTSDSPILCSEHRNSYSLEYEMLDSIEYQVPDITLVGISNARLECIKAKTELENLGYNTNIIHLVDLKPLKFNENQINCIKNSKQIIIVDGDYQICGISEHIAYELMIKYNIKARALGLEDRTAGFATHCDNITPTADNIINIIKSI